MIRAAAYEALRQGVTLRDVIALAKRVRSRHPETGLVLFSYYNLLFANGLEKFADEAADAGIDAVLAVDLPLEEAIDRAPSLPKETILLVCLSGRGDKDLENILAYKKSRSTMQNM